MTLPRIPAIALALFFILAPLAPRAAADLTADQLLLIVNKNEPESRPLAEYYAEARLVPRDQICELNLPTTDQIPFEVYEHDVIPPVRAFLKDHHLEDRVRCLVTFYGIPLRLSNRTASPQEKLEIHQDNAELDQLRPLLNSACQHLEKIAGEVNPRFHPQIIGRPAGIESLRERLRAAAVVVESAAAIESDPQRRAAMEDALDQARGVIEAPAYRLLGPQTRPASAVTSNAPPTTDEAGMPADQTEILRGLLLDYFEPSARQQARDIMRNGPAILYALLLDGQVQCLATVDTQSAFDNELALLWCPQYPRQHYLLNPLYAREPMAGLLPPIMVARLDAPQPQQVRQMILTSLRTERAGLQGRFVIDARGLSQRNPDGSLNGYFGFDQSLIRLAAILRAKTKLDVFLDDKPDLIPPHSQKNVAVYCGWYSPGQFVPSCDFAPGAVGFHAASFEMTSLHDPNNHGWCRGLINDGVVATLGPVAEPYLSAFPPPEEFFPLLLTGKLTLAEVYWRSNPMTSWMMTLVGDPLYRPYAKNPAISVQDLPPRCREAVEQSTLSGGAPATGG